MKIKPTGAAGALATGKKLVLPDLIAFFVDAFVVKLALVKSCRDIHLLITSLIKNVFSSF